MLADLPFTDWEPSGGLPPRAAPLCNKGRAVGVGPPDPCTTAGDMETFSTLVLTGFM